MSTISSSPLLPYSNASIVISYGDTITPQIIDGRYSLGGGNTVRYLVECYLVRVQASRTDTSIGSASGYRDNTVGVQLNRFLYRGYCLRYTTISDTFQHGTDSEVGFTYTDIGQPNGEVPIFLNNDMGNRHITIRHGKQFIGDGYIEIMGSVYGSVGIDRIIYAEIGGIPIVLRGSDQG